MQHFGALLLEIGRTILTLRMGQSSAESVVNSGPAVYISPSGPNPIMVQPFPLQTSSLFGGSGAPNHMPFGPVATGNPQRHVNIHIHAGTTLAPIISVAGARTSNGDRKQTGRGNTRVLPVRNVIATAVPVRPTAPVVPNVAASPDPPSSDPNSTSSLVAEINSWLREMVNNMQGDNLDPSGQSQTTVPNSSGGIPEGQKPGGCSSNSEDVAGATGGETSLPGASLSSAGQTTTKSENTSEATASSSKSRDIAEGDKPLPLGLGLSLERKGISKGRQGREAQNIVKVYLANFRLKEVSTDVLVTAYEPLIINPLSESASAVGNGLAIPASQSGFIPMSEVFKLAVSSFKINDWTLFGPYARSS